jgi:hypothetical protein
MRTASVAIYKLLKGFFIHPANLSIIPRVVLFSWQIKSCPSVVRAETDTAACFNVPKLNRIFLAVVFLTPFSDKRDCVSLVSLELGTTTTGFGNH